MSEYETCARCGRTYLDSQDYDEHDCIITALPLDWERCSEHVVRRSGGDLCDLPVVAVRIDPDDEMFVYPVCKNHVSGHMVPLDAIRTDLIHEIREQVAREIEAFGDSSGVGAYGDYGPPAIAVSDAASIARGKDA